MRSQVTVLCIVSWLTRVVNVIARNKAENNDGVLPCLAEYDHRLKEFTVLWDHSPEPHSETLATSVAYSGLLRTHESPESLEFSD